MKAMLKWWVVGVFLLATMHTFAQGTSYKSIPKGWHLMDKDKDGYYGISLDKAYEFVRSKKLKSKTVIVAVIDSGVDTLHEDLKGMLWINPKEIAGNGIDDDHNGYVDDVYGWNFIGGRDGKNVQHDSYEAARVYYRFKQLYNGKIIDTAAMSQEDREQYKMWQKARINIEGGSDDQVDLVFLQRALDVTTKSDSALQIILGKKEYTGTELQEYIPKTAEESKARSVVLYLYTANKIKMETLNKDVTEGFRAYINDIEQKKETAERAPENFRDSIVKDNEEDINDQYYGNSDVMAGSPLSRNLCIWYYCRQPQ